MPRALLVKLQPNQDLTYALEQAVRDAGIAGAAIVSAVGSIIEGMLLEAGGIAHVPGPAIEVASLTGQVHADGGSRLHGYLCQADTAVAAGIFAPGLNAVAVTFELLLEEQPWGM